MASIFERGPYRHQAQVRRKGYPDQTKTFESKRDAEVWARSIESQMDRSVFVDRTEAERTTLADALARYAREVTPTKKSWRGELTLIKRLQRHPLAARTLASLRAVDFSVYRDSRLECVSANTVRIELALISSLFSTARKDWSIFVENPIATIRKPPPGAPRSRRLIVDEQQRLLAAGDDPVVQSSIAFCITLAIETGMRSGEMASLTWEQIDLANHVIRIDSIKAKNNESRFVPLSVAAEEAIRALPRPLHGGKVTSFYDSNGVSAAFRRVCKRAGIAGLTFHDLRHEAASRFAPHMPVATLAKVMGWKTLQMAMRYYNPTAEELVKAVRRIA